MQIPNTIQQAIDHYHNSYRHPNLSPFVFSELYDLFPEKISDNHTGMQWPDLWPFNDKPGVYLIFNSQMNLLYIGKAVKLGARLSKYFQFSAGRGSSCRIVHGSWKDLPRFVLTISVGNSFEASSLEEYLISELNPAENVLRFGK